MNNQSTIANSQPSRAGAPAPNGLTVVKCISLWQPWASAVALELKPVETRPRRTHVRGMIGIHAGLRHDAELAGFADLLFDEYEEFREAFQDYKGCHLLPRGAVVCVAELVDCVPTDSDHYRIRTLSPVERALGDFSAGRWAWVLTNIRRFKTPVPVKGAQGWFNVPLDLSNLEEPTA